MSRRVFLLGVGLALLALGLAFTDWALTPPWTPGVTIANVKRLRSGMSLEEAKVIMRVPGSCLERSPIGLDIRRFVPETWIWISAEVAVRVHCDAAGRIERIFWVPRTRSQPGLLARLRAWLGW